MLDYLERQGLFEREEVRSKAVGTGRRRGRRRKYTFRDVVILRAINRLLARGVSVQRIKNAVLTFSRDPKFQCDREMLRYDQETVQYLVTDGKQIYFYNEGRDITSILEGGQEAFLFVLDVGQARKFVMDRDKPAQGRARARR